MRNAYNQDVRTVSRNLVGYMSHTWVLARTARVGEQLPPERMRHVVGTSLRHLYLLNNGRIMDGKIDNCNQDSSGQAVQGGRMPQSLVEWEIAWPAGN